MEVLTYSAYFANNTLHLTLIPLRFIRANELGR
jgi:hypothetical protein